MDKMKQEKFMRLALKLAKRANGFTSPNPLVGAVVVRNGRVVGRGYHQQAGLAHAEIVAMDQAGDACRGASLYVTLEPCSNFGRTGPCVKTILARGIKEVIYAAADPNPLNKGKGARFLRRHRIRVISGVLEEEAKKINQVFIKYITRKLPFITVKVAQSLDGKIATASGDSRWISSDSSRQFTHQLRARADAVLVGINTVLKDNPLLSCRLNGRLYKKQPKKLIIDSRLRLSPDARIFSSLSPAPVIVATTRRAPQARRRTLTKKGIQVIVTKDKQGRVDLIDLCRQLARQQITHILIEGGGEIIASALKMKLVDKMIVVIAPKIIGGRQALTSVEGTGIKQIAKAARLEDIRLRRLGGDLIVEGQVRP